MSLGRLSGLCEQFLRLVCDDTHSLDDACGLGTSELDLSPADYATIIEDAVGLMEPTVDLAIPADDIDTVCQVRAGRENEKGSASVESKPWRIRGAIERNTVLLVR